MKGKLSSVKEETRDHRRRKQGAGITANEEATDEAPLSQNWREAFYDLERGA